VDKGPFSGRIGRPATSLLERNHARVTEATYVLKSLVFAVMGLITSHALTLGIANGGVALVLLLVREEPGSLVSRIVSRIAIQLNRSAGHLEALFTWLTLVIWWGSTGSRCPCRHHRRPLTPNWRGRRSSRDAGRDMA
jgi:hypothetical protein